jgi:rod shape-determining protein MreD
VLVLHNIAPLHHLVVPSLYFLFILWLPFETGRRTLMVLGFLLGISIDSFLKTPGAHAAACVLIAYIRPFLVNLLIPQEGAEMNYDEPSMKSMGFAPYFTYVVILTIMHHAWLYLLEALQFGGMLYFILKTLLSSAISILLIIVVDMLFVRRQKFRTNTA